MLNEVPLRRLQPPVDLKQHLLIKQLLAAEIFIDHPLVDGGGGGDLVHPGAVEPFFGELSLRRLQDILPGAFGVPFPPGRHRASPH